jgi:DNA-binding NarL/FixJ family response regulator
MTTVIVADDHSMIRAGLRSVLADMPGMHLVAEVDSGEAAVAAAIDHQPDLIIMDLYMPPGMDGLEATRQIRGHCPATRVMVLTMNEEDAALIAAMQSGACAYLVKGASYEEIQGAITAVITGEAVFGAGVAARIRDMLANAPVTDPAAAAGLSDREREVLILLASGRGTPEIARQLYLAPKTVRNHISAILTKLDVPDRAQAISWARATKLAPPNS